MEVPCKGDWWNWSTFHQTGPHALEHMLTTKGCYEHALSIMRLLVVQLISIKCQFVSNFLMSLMSCKRSKQHQWIDQLEKAFPPRLVFL